MIRSTPHPPHRTRFGEASPFTVNPETGIEEVLILASEYLSCAAATAYEAADNSTPEFRPLARSVMHQLAAARVLVEAAVARMERGSAGGAASVLVRGDNVREGPRSVSGRQGR